MMDEHQIEADSSVETPELGTMISVDLQESGLLWLINRVVFHPWGFALAKTDDATFFLCGDGKEPWSFGELTDNEYFLRVHETFARLNEALEASQDDGSGTDDSSS